MAKADDKFNPDQILKIDKLREVIEQPDKFAEVFCNVAETQVKVQKVIHSQIKDSLKTDHDVRESVKSLVKEIENDNFKGYVKYLFVVFGFILSAFVGTTITIIVQKVMGSGTP